MSPFQAQMSNVALDLFLQVWDDFLFYLSSSLGDQILFAFKLIALIISLLLGAAIAYLLIQINPVGKKISDLKEILRRSSLEKGRVIKGWKKIMERMSQPNEADYKLAIIEADKLFDNLLLEIGYKGETMAEKLKKINKAQLASLDDLWRAHKIRNELVHNPDFKLARLEAEEAINIYKKALEEFEIL
ncbi:MAG: hypothetical protein HYV52_02645 [Parcubacteria group bacterium]|nr:hypothetical protein [Parcubacteria group bacterium]